MNDWLDTLLNVEVFAFIGLLIYLYLKPVSVEGNGASVNSNKDDVA